MTLLRTALIVYIAALMLGVSACAIYAAWFTRPVTNQSTLVGWALHYAGYAIVGIALFLIAGLALAGLLRLGLELFR